MNETTVREQEQTPWEHFIATNIMPGIVDAILAEPEAFIKELSKRDLLVSTIPLAHGEAEIPSEFICIQVGK